LCSAQTITVDSLYSLDDSAQPGASAPPAGARTDFFCGSPVVVLNFTDLPAGTYALAILSRNRRAKTPADFTGSLETADHRWVLAGFFSKP